VTTPDLGRRPRKDAVANRAVILSAAAESIAQDPHASIDAIARRAGLSRRALYGHFDDRGDLVRATLRSGAERFNRIADEVDATASAPLSLARLAAALWREAAHVQLAAAIALDDAHVEETAAILSPLRRRVMAIVRSGRDDGSLRGDVSAPTLARLIEETARLVVTRLDTTSPDAAALAVRAILSIAGLGWRETDELLRAHTELPA
jgi:AcrR family transcriptional regulator